jgi:hypothetical protein
MLEFLKSLLTAQTGSLLILFGMVLLLLAIVGAVKGKISLDSRARLTGGALGLISLTFGVWLQTHTPPPLIPAQAQPNATLPSQSAPRLGDPASQEGSKPAVRSTMKSARPPDPAIQKPVPPKPTSSQQDFGGLPKTTPPVAQNPNGESSQTCRINPEPWRWTTTGKLLIEVDSRLVGVINVGKDQSGFDFVCSPGDHKYRVRSDTISVACTGAIVLETGTTTLDLVFSQRSPGPPDCSLAVTSNRRD